MFIGNFLKRLEFNLKKLNKKQTIESEDFREIIFQILDLKDFAHVDITTRNHKIVIEDSCADCKFTMINNKTNVIYKITFNFEDEKSYFIRTNIEIKEFSINDTITFVREFKEEISSMIEDKEIYAYGDMNAKEKSQIIKYVRSLIKKGYKNLKIKIENDNNTDNFKIYYNGNLIIEYKAHEDELYYLGKLQRSTSDFEYIIARNVW